MVEYIVDGISNTPHNISDRESILRLKLCEYYLKKRIHFHLHFKMSDAEQFCALIYRPRVAHWTEDLEWSPDTEIPRDVPDGGTVGDYMEMPMFIGITQEPETRESWILCVARLQAIDNCDCRRGDPIQPRLLSRFVFTEAIEDRELISGSRDVAIEEYKLPDQMVKGGIEIVKTISNKQRDTVGDDWRLSIQLPELLPCLMVKVVGDTVQFPMGEWLQFGFQSVEMFHCSCYLKSRAGERCHESEISQNTKDTQGLRDTNSYQGRGVQGTEEGGRAYREGLRDSQPPGEGLAQTELSPSPDSSTAKHTHSSSLEDA